MKTVEQAWKENGVDEDLPVHDFFLAGGMLLLRQLDRWKKNEWPVGAKHAAQSH